jgi:hypothetical protein
MAFPFTTIPTTVPAANFNSASATPVNFKMKRSAKKILCALFACLATGSAAMTASAQTASILGNMPLFFETGPAQTEFIARGRDSQFSVSPNETQIILRKSGTKSSVMQLRFVGANPSAQIRGDAELSGKINYLVGDNSAQWRSGISTFGKVSVDEIYPGIGLVYYGNQQRLEYDFTIAPGANPNAIEIRFDGAEKISVNTQGELVLTLSNGEIRQPKPLIYQVAGGGRKTIIGGYKILDARTVAFSIGEYDRALPLVIDPVLSYSTYFGGTLGETAWAVAVNTNDGSIYIAGQTLSKIFTNGVNFATSGAFQTNFAGGKVTGDGFVAKFDNTGQNLIYLTYLGGSADDAIYGIAVDAAGDAFVTGFTQSPNFPTTTNAIYPHISGPFYKDFNSYASDAFVAELNSGGSNLIYSTYLGGESSEAAYGIAVDSSGDAYVTGFTYSTNFPTTNAIQNHLACTNSFDLNANAFVTEIAAGGTNLVFSTYLGGTNFDQGQGIAVDGAGYVYVTGYTASTNFPTWNTPTNLPNSHLLNGSTNKNNFDLDAFVTKLPPFSDWTYSASNQVDSVSNLANSYSTYLGGTNNDMGRSIACDAAGDAFVTGWTTSTNFPNTATNVPGLFSFVATNTTSTFATNAFLTEINPSGAAVVYSALFGGKASDIGNGVAVDAAGDAFVVGSTTSTNFPTTNTIGFLRATNSSTKSGSDVFVIAFNTNATALLYSAYLGGRSDDFGYGIALDSMDDAYIAGSTASTNFPTANAPQNLRNGTNDAFVAEIIFTPLLPEIVMQPMPTNQAASVGATVTFNATAAGTTPLSFQWQFNGTNLTNGAQINGSFITGASSTGIATNTTLTISSAQTTNSGNYTVIVTNYAGSVTSSVAVLTVTNIATVLTQQPVSQTVGVGSTVTFSVNGTGQTPVYLQWMKNGTNLMNGGRISNATATNNGTLTISDAQTNDDGTYQVVVSNVWGVVTSSNALLLVTNVSPLILVQPMDQIVGMGTTATMAVTATGTAPLSYQWQVNGTNLTDGGPKNGTIISGATTNVLKITQAQLTDSGTYTVIITNFVGSVTSSNAVLTVVSAPEITVQPTNQSLSVGANVTLNVTAVGTLPLSYHWQLNGTNLTNKGSISGATTDVLKISNVQTNNSGSYTVVVTNIAGSATSSNAILVVTNVPPTITMQPTNEALAVGTTATLTVTAIGTTPLSYQWQVNGTNLVNGGHISGATTDALKISNAQTNNNGSYTVVVTNIAGSVISSNAMLTIASSPIIIVQPTNQSLAVGATATLIVSAVGTLPLSYQWQKNGTNVLNSGQISGATTNVLRISNAQTNDSGSYTVVVTNRAGLATSSNAVVTVTNSPPTITLQPTNQTVELGTTVTFNVAATGTAPLSYQWQLNGTNLVDESSINGATSNLLTIAIAETNNSGIYTVIVTNIAGSVTSSNAVLSVLLPPIFGNIIAASDGSFILNGNGGLSNDTYYVLTSSNLAVPLGLWTPIATNQFDSQGQFIFTNIPPTNAPQLFYILQMQ